MSKQHKRGTAGRRYQLERCNACLDRKLPEALLDGLCPSCRRDPARIHIRGG